MTSQPTEVASEAPCLVEPASAGACAPSDPVNAPTALPPPTRLARWGYPLLGIALWLIYLPTLARGATFSDGPELVSAIRALGVAHPTGYPIFILVGHAFAGLFPASVPYILRIEILNALFGAGGAVLTAYATRLLTLLTLRPGDEPRDAELAGFASAALMGLSSMLWGQLHVPEVYALHFFLVAWACYCWMRYEVTRRPSAIVAAALPMGLGLAHHVTMVYMFPAALVYLLVRRPIFLVAWITTPLTRVVRRFRPSFRAGQPLDPWWGFLVANLVGFLPLLSYAYLLWANNHSAGIPWGDVSGWENLYNHFTGKQYQGFMHKLDPMGHLQRIKVIPDLFDQQFLPVGTVLFLAGLPASFRGALRPSLFFITFLFFNAAHGVHYGVGDYGTYYIPGFYACAVFMGPGLAWLLHLARTRQPEERGYLGLALLGAMLLITGVTLGIYGRFTHRLPPPLAAHPFWFAVPVALVGGGLLSTSVIVQERGIKRWNVSARLLPALLGAGIVLPMLSASIARAHDLAREPTLGESYARELSEHIPRGAVLLTQGDGFLFSMWYASHVLEQGLDVATIDVANVRTPWYVRYIRSHHPLSCDPLGPEAKLASWMERCQSFDQRMRLHEASSWVPLDLAGNRKPFAGLNAAAARVLRGNDPMCADKKFKDEHIMKECRCYAYGKNSGPAEGAIEEDCVMSAEEHGVVPREGPDLLAQRFLEDFLDERPIYERNVLTRWDPAAENPRGWDGPSYQRISADYALINRGRFNQLVYSADLQGFDPCAGDTLRELPLRPFVKPRTIHRGSDRRRLYQPNHRPTLMAATWLLRSKTDREDASIRGFASDAPVWLKVDWFEKFKWDAQKTDKRGTALHHAVRVCVFDPGGHKVTEQVTRSGVGQDEPLPLLSAGPHAPGQWRVRACDIDESGDAPVAGFESRGCGWPLLDHGFTIEPGGR